MFYVVILLFVIFFVLFKFKIKRGVLKNKVRFTRKNLNAIFYTMPLKLNYFDYKNYDVPLKKLALLDHIISCVLYSSPKFYNDKLNLTMMKNFGIDIKKPILYFDKLDDKLFESISIAKQYTQFNAITNANYENKYQSKNLLYLDTQFCDIKLFSSIMVFNVYSKEKFKVQDFKHEMLQLFVNNRPLSLKYLITDNQNCYSYQNGEIKVFIGHFNDSGDYFKVLVENTGKSKKFDFLFNFDLDEKNYFIKKINSYYLIENVLSKQKAYITCNKKIDINCYIDKVKKPFIQIKKHILLEKSKKYEFIIFIGDNASKNKLDSALISYKEKINNYFNIKLKSKNVKLNYLVNYYLKRNVTTSRYKLLSNDNFDEVQKQYKLHKISALDFYMWIKQKYLGIFECENKLKIEPLLKEDFDCEIFINGKSTLVEVRLYGELKNCIVLNGVKYHNINFLTYDNLNNCDKLLVFM